jgi:predicted phosphodiesterase
LNTVDGDQSRLEKLTRIEELLESNGVSVDEIGSVKNIRVKKWQAVAKGKSTRNDEGKIIDQEPSKVVDLESTSVLISPSWAEGPKWELPHRANPITVKVPTRTPALLKGWKTAALLPDTQFGFRRDLQTAALDPFHDDRALDVSLQILDGERPDLTIFLGDVLDLASFGKYRQEPGFVLTVQPTIDTAYEYIAKAMAYSKEGRFIEGNHDVRLQNMIIDNAVAAFGIRRAAAPPSEWPVLSVPFLLNLDDLGVKYVGGYPAGATYINDNLAAIHGRKVGNDRRSAATMVVEDERVSVVFGHVHRIETTYRTRNTRGAAKISLAHTPGCLCRIDGAVPGVKGGMDAFGHAVKSWENWQNGMTIVRYQEGDGKFAIETIPIIEGWALHGGQEFVSRVTPEWATP